MDLKKIKNVTDQMIKHFINSMELDGDYYVSCMDCSIMFGSCLGLGKFYTPNSPDLEMRFKRMLIPAKQKKEIRDSGLIIINDKFSNAELNPELILTIIHETFHSNRVLLVNSQNKPDENVESVLEIDGRLIQTSSNDNAQYVDANQDLVHGSIDTSKNAIRNFELLNQDKKEELTDFDDKVYSKREYYQYVDEALVELMSLLSIYLTKQNSNDVMDMIARINRNYDGDTKAITNIILRHGNLDLLKWMLDPLTYQANDISYDYLKNYLTKDDYTDINSLIYESEEYGFDSIISEIGGFKKAN